MHNKFLICSLMLAQLSAYAADADAKKTHDALPILCVEDNSASTSVATVYLQSTGTHTSPFPATLVLYSESFIKGSEPTYKSYTIENTGNTIEIGNKMPFNDPNISQFLHENFLNTLRAENGGVLPDSCKQEFEQLQEQFKKQPHSRKIEQSSDQIRWKALWRMALNIAGNSSTKTKIAQESLLVLFKSTQEAPKSNSEKADEKSATAGSAAS